MILIVAVALFVILLISGTALNVLPSSCSIYGTLKCGDVIYGGNVLNGGSKLIVRVSMEVPGTVNVSGFNAVEGDPASTGGYCTNNGNPPNTGASTAASQGQVLICEATFQPNVVIAQTYSGTFNISANYCPSTAHGLVCKQANSYKFSGSWLSRGVYNAGITTTTSTSTTSSTSVTSTSTSTSTTSSTGTGSVTVYTSIVPYSYNACVQFDATQTDGLVFKVSNYDTGAPVPSGFQLPITFDPSGFAAYEAPDLGNVRFFVGNLIDGVTYLPSWCESGCNYTSSQSTFWVKLPAIGWNGVDSDEAAIDPGSSLLVNMTFEPSGISSYEYGTGGAGEAPWFGREPVNNIAVANASAPACSLGEGGNCVWPPSKGNLPGTQSWSAPYSVTATIPTDNRDFGLCAAALGLYAQPDEYGISAFFGGIPLNVSIKDYAQLGEWGSGFCTAYQPYGEFYNETIDPIDGTFWTSVAGIAYYGTSTTEDGTGLVWYDNDTNAIGSYSYGGTIYSTLQTNLTYTVLSAKSTAIILVSCSDILCLDSASIPGYINNVAEYSPGQVPNGCTQVEGVGSMNTTGYFPPWYYFSEFIYVCPDQQPGRYTFTQNGIEYGINPYIHNELQPQGITPEILVQAYVTTDYGSYDNAPDIFDYYAPSSYSGDGYSYDNGYLYNYDMWTAGNGHSNGATARGGPGADVGSNASGLDHFQTLYDWYVNASDEPLKSSISLINFSDRTITFYANVTGGIGCLTVQGMDGANAVTAIIGANPGLSSTCAPLGPSGYGSESSLDQWSKYDLVLSGNTAYLYVNTPDAGIGDMGAIEGFYNLAVPESDLDSGGGTPSTFILTTEGDNTLDTMYLNGFVVRQSAPGFLGLFMPSARPIGACLSTPPVTITSTSTTTSISTSIVHVPTIPTIYYPQPLPPDNPVTVTSTSTTTTTSASTSSSTSSSTTSTSHTTSTSTTTTSSTTSSSTTTVVIYDPCTDPPVKVMNDTGRYSNRYYWSCDAKVTIPVYYTMDVNQITCSPVQTLYNPPLKAKLYWGSTANTPGLNCWPYVLVGVCAPDLNIGVCEPDGGWPGSLWEFGCSSGTAVEVAEGWAGTDPLGAPYYSWDSLGWPTYDTNQIIQDENICNVWGG